MGIYRRLFCFIIVMFILSGCSISIENGMNNSVAYATSMGKGKTPVMWVEESGQMFQPTFGQRTIKGFEHLQKNKIQMDGTGVNFIFTREEMETWVDPGMLQVSVYNKNNENLYRVELEAVEGMYSFEQDGMMNLSVGESYYMDVVVLGDESEFHYYLPFLYVEKSQNLLGVSYVAEAIERYNDDMEIMLMGNQRIQIEATQETLMYIYADYVGAKRGQEGFAPLDFTQKYSVNFDSMDVERVEEKVKEKRRYYYSKEEEGWYLGDLEEQGERFVMTSQNQRYEVIYNSEEMYMYDRKRERMYEIYRLDHLNSDYIYDENIQHGIEVFNVSNEGDVHFSVYGYIQDLSPNYGRNGIVFYQYSLQNDPVLYSLGIIESPEDYRQMSTDFSEMFYYNEVNNSLYILYEQSLYQLNFDTHNFTYVETFIRGKMDGDRGVIYWEDQRNKYNNAVHIVDLSGSGLTYTNLFELGSYKHVLEAIDGQIFVGEYNLEDTYEYLNGQVVFPYHTIKQYSAQGNVVDVYYASDYGENYFFSGIYLDDTELKYKVDMMAMKIVPSENYKNSKVYFVDTEATVPLNVGSITEKNSLKSSVIKTKTALDSADYLDTVAGVSYKNNNELKFREMPPLDVYVVYDRIKKARYFTTELNEAFVYSDKMKEYTVYHWKYNVQKDSGDLQEIYSNSNARESMYLSDIVVIPQRPELPRGCEVTALSILLNRYMEDPPSKMVLTEQIKTSGDTYEIKNGFVHFSDMHLEFSGSASDTTKPGLGVYIDPIQQLAEKYVSNRAKKVSGLSFEQLLGLVSQNIPVLIITPNRYQEVLDYSKQVWVTPSGFMEVTYQEHSVVVMGFDERYVYYSDPSKARIDKKNRDDFQRGWESMGNQGMIVLD